MPSGKKSLMVDTIQPWVTERKGKHKLGMYDNGDYTKQKLLNNALTFTNMRPSKKP